MESVPNFRHVQNKAISAIYAVDFEDEPDQDIYYPWQYLICFEHSPVFLDLEDAADGEHLRVSWRASAEFESYLHGLGEKGLWKPYPVAVHEPLGALLGHAFTRACYATDKELTERIGTWPPGCPQVYKGVRLEGIAHALTVFSNGVGLFAGLDTDAQPPFEKTYDWMTFD